MFDSLLFQKGYFKVLQFSLKQMIAAHFICIIKWHIPSQKNSEILPLHSGIIVVLSKK